MRMLIRVLGAVVVSFLFAACGDDDESVSSGGDGDGTSIEGEFVATEVAEGGQPKALVEGTSIRLRLEDGALTASAGCNSIGGDYTVADGVLRVSATSMTEMGCDPPRHAQDEWLAGVLSAEPTVERTDRSLVLETATVTITFVDESVANPDRELTGTSWVVDGYVDGAGPDGVTSSAPGDTALFVFDANGFVTGNDGCNGFGFGGETGAAATDGLRYEIDGNRITFTGSAVTTDMACPGVDTDRFWAVLMDTVTWTIDGARLTLVADDDRGVTYRAKS
jgi:heat shock protein HslJ